MSAVLERCTTEYAEDEDRLRLSAELANGNTVVLWLTQRLLNRLVPHLVQWLEKQTAGVAAISSVQARTSNAMQGFAQERRGQR